MTVQGGIKTNRIAAYQKNERSRARRDGAPWTGLAVTGSGRPEIRTALGRRTPDRPAQI